MSAKTQRRRFWTIVNFAAKDHTNHTILDNVHTAPKTKNHMSAKTQRHCFWTIGNFAAQDHTNHTILDNVHTAPKTKIT